MPTTQEEAAKIVSISQEYMSYDEMKQLFIRLDDEVGKFTDNSSLKTSLSMMRMLVDPPVIPPKPFWLKPALYFLIAAHAAVVIGVTVAFFLLPFNAPWFIALPLMSFIFFFSTTRVNCRCTDLENNLRKELGMKPIPGFIGYYFLKPLKKLFGKNPT